MPSKTHQIVRGKVRIAAGNTVPIPRLRRSIYNTRHPVPLPLRARTVRVRNPPKKALGGQGRMILFNGVGPKR